MADVQPVDNITTDDIQAKWNAYFKKYCRPLRLIIAPPQSDANAQRQIEAMTNEIAALEQEARDANDREALAAARTDELEAKRLELEKQNKLFEELVGLLR